MSDEVQEKVQKHDIQLAKMEISLTNLAASTERIATSMIKQEVILEKLTAMKSASDESFKRVHHRIDTNENDIKEINNTIGWFWKTTLGAIITGAIGILYFLAKSPGA